ncbi:MAG TPA: helix-turn-helix domain-containing protein [Bacillota bacterium]|nr:helix-turn-helix domain-containing protein [Bacillota bacterium]
MDETLKVTSVLSDPTRFHIYQFIIKHHSAVSAAEISKRFDIHPNVARLHLSKLEDVQLIESFTQKTGKGGRPSRLYKLSTEAIDLHFPYRDYKLLSAVALKSLMELGEIGQKALYKTGREYGAKLMEKHYTTPLSRDLTVQEKIRILEDAGTVLGMYPDFEYDKSNQRILFKINNCPFKEVASTNENHTLICNMHTSFLKGMFETLFANIELVEQENMFQGCANCLYVAKLGNVSSNSFTRS